jgi:hypothetical protein
MSVDTFLKIAKKCVAKGTPVSLADGTSVPIEEVRPGDLVLSRDLWGVGAYAVSEVTPMGRKACVELLFSDGRLLVCTPDHPVLTAQGEWVEASDLVVGTSSVVTAAAYPVRSRSTLDGWSLDVPPLGYALSLDGGLSGERTLAFSRLLGYLLSDGKVDRPDPTAAAVLHLDHSLDAAQAVAEVALLTGTTPVIHRSHKTYDVDLPRPLFAAYVGLGVAGGARVGQVAHVPDFLLAASCPLPVVREFLAGLFGGDGHTPSLSHAADGDKLMPVEWSCSKVGKVVRQQHAAVLAELLPLLARFGLSAAVSVKEASECGLIEAGAVSISRKKAAGEALSRVVSLEEELEAGRTYTIMVSLDTASTLPFAAKVGFRFCCHKQQRLAAACSVLGAAAYVAAQRRAVKEGVEALRAAGHVPYARAVSRAKADLEARQVLHPTTVQWKPASDFELGFVDTVKDKELKVSVLLDAHDARKVFSGHTYSAETSRAASSSFSGAASSASAVSLSQEEGKEQSSKRASPASSRDASPARPSKSSRASKESFSFDSAASPSSSPAASRPASAPESGRQGEGKAKVTYAVPAGSPSVPSFVATLVGSRAVGEREVFDLTVPRVQGDDFASFVANGIVSNKRCTH